MTEVNNIKIISSILDVVESKDLDVSADLNKDEKTSASIKELFDKDKEPNDKKESE